MKSLIFSLALASLALHLTACSKRTVGDERECAEASIAVANALKEAMSSPVDVRTEGGLAHAAAKRWQEKVCK